MSKNVFVLRKKRRKKKKKEDSYAPTGVRGLKVDMREIPDPPPPEKK